MPSGNHALGLIPSQEPYPWRVWAASAACPLEFTFTDQSTHHGKLESRRSLSWYGQRGQGAKLGSFPLIRE